MLLPLHNNLTVAPLLGGLSLSHRPHFAEYRRHAYMSNGWDPVYRWNGRSPGMELAGIVSPDQDDGTWVPVVPVVGVFGLTTIGIHRVRYRYMDSVTGYVSNPSDSVEINIAGGPQQYPFTMEAAPGAGTVADIRQSTDPKVDRIVLEATVADGTEYFLVDDFPMDGATIIYNVADPVLEHSFLPWDPDGHDVPPIGRWIVSHRERLWIFGQVVHKVGNVVTQASVDVLEGNVETDWRTSALGDAKVPVPGGTFTTDVSTDLVLPITDPPSTPFNLLWTIENQDDDGLIVVPLTTFTVTVDGDLQIDGTATWSEDATGQRFVNILKNGAPVFSTNTVAALFGVTNLPYSYLMAGTLIGDTIAIEVIHTAVGNLGTGGVVTLVRTAAGFAGAPSIFPSVAWLFQADGDAVAYELDYYDEVNDKLVLVDAYAGVPAANVGYKLFSRANLLWVSNAGFPEAFAPLTFINGPQGELSGEITACIGFNTAMIVFSESAMYRLTWDIGPQIDPVLVPVSTKYGALSQRVVVNVETTVYTMDRLGWHSFGGVRDLHMSKDIDELLELIDFDRLDDFHAVYLPRTRAIRWHVVYKGEDLPFRYVQHDLDTKSWSTGSFEVPIMESRLVLTKQGPRVLLGDGNGWLWTAERGEADGAPNTDTHLEVGPGSVPTSVQVVDDLSVGTFGMAGAIAYWVEGEEARYVRSNTIGQISTDPFSAAPAEGDTILVGRIRARLKTKAFGARQGTRLVARQDYVWLLANPTKEVRHALVRFYEDGSSEPKRDWGSVRKAKSIDGVESPGSVVGVADSDWRVDLSKVTLRVPTGESFKRTL